MLWQQRLCVTPRITPLAPHLPEGFFVIACESLGIEQGRCQLFQIPRKGRHQATGGVADLSAERADSAPNVFTWIHVHCTVTGKALDPKRVEQAVHLSTEKYCSASIMLDKAAEITHNFDIVES